MRTVSSCRHVSFGPHVARTIGWGSGVRDGWLHAPQRHVNVPCARGAFSDQTDISSHGGSMPTCARTGLYRPVGLRQICQQFNNISLSTKRTMSTLSFIFCSAWPSSPTSCMSTRALMKRSWLVAFSTRLIISICVIYIFLQWVELVF